MAGNAIKNALNAATQAALVRQLQANRDAEKTTGTLTGTLTGHDPATGEDVFRTSTGGTVRAQSNTNSGLPRGSTLQLPRSDQSPQLYYDRPPVPSEDRAVPVAGASPTVGGTTQQAGALIEQIDVVIPEPEEGTILLVQHQAYRVRIDALFVGGGMTAAVIPAVGNTVTVGGQISLNVLSVSSGAGNASIVLQRVAG